MHPESVALAASKLMLKRFKELLEANQNIAFETTAAGKNYVKHLKNAQANGYVVHLTFLWLSSPSLAISRVKQRVLQGGHHVPDETVNRRYYSGIKNLIDHYLPLADSAIIFDNSRGELNQVIARKHLSNGLKIENPIIWEEINKVAAYEQK